MGSLGFPAKLVLTHFSSIILELRTEEASFLWYSVLDNKELCEQKPLRQ